jgi:hypothetical protein
MAWERLKWLFRVAIASVSLYLALKKRPPRSD